METIQYVNLLTFTNEQLTSEIKSILTSVKEQSIKHDWLIHGNIDLTDQEIQDLIKLKREKSTNAYKDFIQSLYRAQFKQTKKAYNMFLRKLSSVNKIHITVGLKEQAIQDKRKKWLELRKAAELALLEYKVEKGDFYKKQL